MIYIYTPYIDPSSVMFGPKREKLVLILNPVNRPNHHRLPADAAQIGAILNIIIQFIKVKIPFSSIKPENMYNISDDKLNFLFMIGRKNLSTTQI